jgi:hypothetical protein
MRNVKRVGVWLLVCNCSTPWKYLKVRHPYNYWMTIYKIWISLYLPGSHNFEFEALEITTQSSLKLLPYNTYKTSREWRCGSSAHVLHMYHGHRLIPWDPYYCCCHRSSSIAAAVISLTDEIRAHWRVFICKIPACLTAVRDSGERGDEYARHGRSEGIRACMDSYE